MNTDFALWHVARLRVGVPRRPRRPGAVGAGRGGHRGPVVGQRSAFPQGGVEMNLRAAGGRGSYARASLVGRAALPLLRDLRLGLAAGGGTSWGRPPPQRLWAMGGTGTLRGYAPRVRVGTTYLRGQGGARPAVLLRRPVRVRRRAWAGGRDQIRFDDALLSVGVGLSAVDGLIRLDGGVGAAGAAGLPPRRCIWTASSETSTIAGPDRRFPPVASVCCEDLRCRGCRPSRSSP